MLDIETKRRIDTARDILVGKVPNPKSQVSRLGCMALLLCVVGCDSGHLVGRLNNSKTRVVASFQLMQQAMARGDEKAVVSQLTPATVGLFQSALDITKNPDKVDLEQAPQMAVILGFQAIWLVSEPEREKMTVPAFFAWGARNGTVPVNGLATVNLCNVVVSNNHATAFASNNGVVLTNLTLEFELHGGKWKFDFGKFLIAGEDQLDRIRKMRRIKKSEMAVLVIENAYRQPIPALRELLLAPAVRVEITRLRNGPASEVNKQALLELSKGRQRAAESLLEFFVAVHTNDQQLAFLQAVCSRSRWSKDEAGVQFRHVLSLDPTTPEANAARLILDLDERKNVSGNMESLRFLKDNHPDNPLFSWLMAMECRDHYKLTGETIYSGEAEQCYRRILKLWETGPVLLHQTFANVLSEELHKYDEALDHRRIAVQLEPKSWSYQGLANTLSAMQRYPEANEAYAKLVELDPDDADYWDSWANSLQHQDRYEDCIEKCKKTLAVDPAYFKAYHKWGYSLEQLGHLDEALTMYVKASKINPTDEYAYDGQFRILLKLGRTNEAGQVNLSKFNMLSRTKRLHFKKNTPPPELRK